MSDDLIITIDQVRSVTHTVDPDPAKRWLAFGPYRIDPFVLDDPETDSLRVVESLGGDRFIICNAWYSVRMSAPAFWYFSAHMTATSGEPILSRRAAPFQAEYRPADETIAVGGQRFSFRGVSQAVFQDVSGPEKSAPALAPPLMADPADPTRDEMLAALSDTLKLLGDDEATAQSDAEVAVYWYANDHHGGQSTNLYSALSTSPYRPGPCSTLESEGDSVRMMYDELVARFSHEGRPT